MRNPVHGPILLPLTLGSNVFQHAEEGVSGVNTKKAVPLFAELLFFVMSSRLKTTAASFPAISPAAFF